MSPLPRVYWCHADAEPPGPPAPFPDLTTSAPGGAAAWVRESVRAFSHAMDRPAFAVVWAWLGDHEALAAAVLALRRGRLYAYTVVTAATQWTWTAYPVSVLPVLHPSSRTRPKTALTLRPGTESVTRKSTSDSTKEIVMALRFIGMDPDTTGGGSPTVWVDEGNREIVIQGWEPTEALTAEVANTVWVEGHDIGILPREAVVRVPVRMVPLLREACDAAERSGLR